MYKSDQYQHSEQCDQYGYRAFDSTIWLKKYEGDFVIVGNQILYRYQGNQKDVVIPDGVTSIVSEAFQGCESLTSVTIPNSVTSIGYSAFKNCKNLTNINIPDGVTGIGNMMFYGCESLTNINIPDGVTSIENNAFCGCTSLTSITIPENVTSIGEYAFYGCTSLTNINIPDGVTSIRYRAFDNTIWLKKYEGDFVIVGDQILCRYQENQKDVVIPDSVTSIGSGAFHGCESLTSVTIPDSVISIEYGSFYGCKNLTSILIPDSEIWIEFGAFYGCESLTSITVPDGVASIEIGSFYNCENLTSVTIPDSVTSIGASVFWGCINLTELTISDSVTHIEEYAFDDCTSLTSIKIAISDGQYFVVDNYNKVERDIVAVTRMLRTGKMDTAVKMPLRLKFQLAVKLIDLYDNADARAYVKKMLTRGVKTLIDGGNLEQIRILLEKTDFVTKKNVNQYIQYAIDQKQQEIYLTLIRYKDEIGA